MNNIGKGNPWSLKLSTVQIVLVPVSIGINYVGKMFAAMLKLPLWLDCIGSCLAACLGGPVVGALSGILNNLLYGMTVDPFATVYALTQAGIAATVGYLAYKGKMDTIVGALTAGVISGAAAVVISTPLNIIFWGGQTGNVWGDAAFASLTAGGTPVWIASLVNETLVDIPDKILVLLITFFILKSLPKSLMTIFSNQDEEVESL